MFKWRSSTLWFLCNMFFLQYKYYYLYVLHCTLVIIMEVHSDVFRWFCGFIYVEKTYIYPSKTSLISCSSHVLWFFNIYLKLFFFPINLLFFTLYFLDIIYMDKSDCINFLYDDTFVPLMWCNYDWIYFFNRRSRKKMSFIK